MLQMVWMSYLGSHSKLPTGAESVTSQHGQGKAFLGRARVNTAINSIYQYLY